MFIQKIKSGFLFSALSCALALILATGCQNAVSSASGTSESAASRAAGTVVTQGSVSIAASGGWFETAWAEWNAVSGATSYNVYYKLASASAYTLADSALVRTTRVDIPGLGGSKTYNIKIVPVSSGTEQTANATIISVATLSYDRSGFAFLPSSTNGTTTGGYNADGTPASTTTILYVTDSNKDSVTCAVTKSSTTTTYTGLVNIMAARQSAKTTVPLIVRFIGTVNPPSGVDSLSLLAIKANANVTFEGVGSNALLYGWGLNIRSATNVEVRNLAFYMFPDDSVSIQTSNRNIWIHNNDFRIGADGGGDKALGDGSCDIKADSSYITISYNHFQGTGKASLCGLSESTEFFVTYHHNYFDASHSRHPRIRTGTIHVYNNFFKDATTYGVGAAEASSVYVQNNYFENCVRPMIIASQGHDYKDLVPSTETAGAHESIMSGEDGGTIKASGNYMDTYSASWFDASVDTGNATTGGATYNNFEAKFSANSYPQTLETAAVARTNAITYAGCLNASGTVIDTTTPTDPTTPTEATATEKVAAAKTLVTTAVSSITYSTSAATLAAVNTAIAGVSGSFGTGVSATAAADSSANIVITIACSGATSATITIAATTTPVTTGVYSFNVTTWATTSQAVDSNFLASAKTLATGLSTYIKFGAGKFRVYATSGTPTLVIGSSTLSFTRYLQLREASSTITITPGDGAIVTLVYSSSSKVAPITLSNATTTSVSNSYTATGCTALSYKVAGTGSMILGKNTASTLLGIIISK